MNPLISNVIDLAESFLGVKEEKQNRGKRIDEIQKYFGFKGVQYCVLFCLYCYVKAFSDNGISLPLLKTASSQSLFEWAKNLKCTYNKPEWVSVGDIAIWRKFNLWQGHAAIVYTPVIENSFQTIEANTSNNDYGSQRDGDGIYRRIRHTRKIDFSVDSFYLRGFIDMRRLIGSLKLPEFDIDHLGFSIIKNQKTERVLK